MIKKVMFVQFILALFFMFSCTDGSSGSDSGSGGGGGGIVELPNIEVTGIETATNSITITWTDPGKAGLDHIDVICSDGTDIDVDPGIGTCTFSSLILNTDYRISFISSYDGSESGENLIYVSTTSAGSLSHEAISTAAEFVDEIENGSGLEGAYFLTDDLDLSSYQTGTGWTPIGDSIDPFEGIFNGNGHEITGLRIDNDTLNYAGFLGRAHYARISNVKIVNCDITGNEEVGGLLGYGAYCDVENCTVTGTVRASYGAGGLIGWFSGNMSNCSSSVTVIGGERSGGLGGICSADVSNCYSTGSVTGTGLFTGGLFGSYTNGILSDCYSKCSVSGGSNTGGFIGYTQGTIVRCYSTGNVTGTDNYTGGLIGENLNSTISDCYCTGTVTGVYYAGGLIGDNKGGVENCFSTSSIVCSDYSGGFFGMNSVTAVISNCYWNITINNGFEDVGNTGDHTNIAGLTTAQMKDAANVATNYVGWDFTTIWNIDGTTNDGYPFLR